MAKLFTSSWTRVLGAAAVAASAAAVVIAVAPSVMPEALAQTGPGSTVPDLGGLQDLFARIIAFLEALFGGFLGFLRN
ncbi:MAG: hypothetical protein AB7R89_25275 [Dehalococcoidia bacterium]